MTSMINEDNLKILSVLMDKELTEDEIMKVFSYFYLLIKDELASCPADDTGKLMDTTLDIGIGTIVCSADNESLEFKFSDEIQNDLLDAWVMGLSDLLYTIHNNLGSRLKVPGLDYYNKGGDVHE